MKKWVPARARNAIRSLLGQKEGMAPDREYLRMQVLVSWEKESRNLQWFGLRDSMSILDLGCGPGYFTEFVAELLPNAAITAVEADTAMLDVARQRFRDELREIVAIEARAEETGLPDASFDFVIARLLFQHLREPSAVVREAMRVLKPGGKFVIMDDDDGIFGLAEPPVEKLDVLLEKYGEAQRSRGGNRRIGRWLPRLLRDGGFVDIEFETVVSHSDHAGLTRIFPQLDAAPLDWLVRGGYLTHAERDAYRAEHKKFFGADDPFALVILFMACGTKGAAQQ
jgi:SAM-dependent methyltransferase